MAKYFTKIKALWDHIGGINPILTCSYNGCVCNLTQKFLKNQQDESLIHFLMRINPNYTGFESNILMMQQLPTISTTYRPLIQEEKQQAVAEAVNQKILNLWNFLLLQGREWRTNLIGHVSCTKELFLAQTTRVFKTHNKREVLTTSFVITARWQDTQEKDAGS